ncbi:MAG: AraC family transcriptional regulator [Mobilicoccus sp.]|nr:AraC family transcriptional regulator [Mobilicoccus sp.]
MDPLSALLDADHDRTSEVWVDGPWTMVLEPESALQILTVLDEDVWIRRPWRPPMRVSTGQVAVLWPDVPHVLGHSVIDDPQATRVEPGPVRVAGARPDRSQVLVRRYPLDESMAGTIVTGLPVDEPLATVSDSDAWPLLRAESTSLSPARSSVIARLLDLLFVDAVRLWSTRDDAHGWLRAGLDPIVGVTLQLLHENPAHPWTLGELADVVGTSRSTLSRRFHLLVGEPPMRYLQQCRLDRAARLLRESTASVRTIAKDTGFSDPFAFSAVFSRRFGSTPARYRASVHASADLA